MQYACTLYRVNCKRKVQGIFMNVVNYSNSWFNTQLAYQMIELEIFEYINECISLAIIFKQI